MLRTLQRFNENGNLMLELNYSFTFCNIDLHTQQITIFRGSRTNTQG